MECTIHPGTHITSVCITCDNKLVCVECMTDKLHKCHEFEKPSKIAIDLKTKLKPKKAEYCKLVSGLELDLNEVRTLQKQQDDGQKERVKSVTTQKEVLIQTVNKIADNFVSVYEMQTQCNRDKLQSALNDISAKLEIVRQNEKDVQRIIEEKDDIAVVHDSQELEKVDIQRKRCPKLASIEFTPGKVNDHQMKLIFGGTNAEMDYIRQLQGELVLESTFKHSESSYVVRMCYGSDGKTWVRCFNGKEITLIDIHGNIEKTVTFNSVVIGMATVIYGTLLLCGVDDRDIKQVTLPSGKVTSAFSTGKLYPLDICTDTSGDLYVTLVDKIEYNVTSDSERVLVKYSSRGQEMCRARYDSRNDALFVSPFKVSNDTVDVTGVINGTDRDNSHLVLLNEDLTLKLRYIGKGKIVHCEEKFDTTIYKPVTDYAITDFIFVSSECIIICEHYSRCIQMLDTDCHPILTLLPRQESVPRSMAMTGDDMWLGFTDGTVKVYTGILDQLWNLVPLFGRTCCLI